MKIKFYRFVGSPTSIEMFSQLGLKSRADKILMCQPDFSSLRVYHLNDDDSKAVVVLSPSRSGSILRQFNARVLETNDALIKAKDGRWYSFDSEQMSKEQVTLTMLTEVHKGILASSGLKITTSLSLVV